jgi:hypothetical protein
VNDLILYEASTNPALSSHLLGIERVMHELVMENLKEAIESKKYSGPELLSMIQFEKLRMANDLDLASVLIKGKILKDIEDKNLWSVHPEHFSSLEDAARYYKISKSMLSNVRDWYNHIFPYLQEKMGMSIPEIWEEIGVSNFREITPVLKSLITGERSKALSVNSSVEHILEDIEATAQAAGQDLDENGKKEMAVEWALDAATRTNDELRKAIRPERTPNILAALMQRNGTTYLLAELTEDQVIMLRRIAGSHFDFAYVDLEQDPPHRVPLVKQLLKAV